MSLALNNWAQISVQFRSSIIRVYVVCHTSLEQQPEFHSPVKTSRSCWACQSTHSNSTDTDLCCLSINIFTHSSRKEWVSDEYFFLISRWKHVSWGLLEVPQWVYILANMFLYFYILFIFFPQNIMLLAAEKFHDMPSPIFSEKKKEEKSVASLYGGTFVNVLYKSDIEHSDLSAHWRLRSACTFCTAWSELETLAIQINSARTLIRLCSYCDLILSWVCVKTIFSLCVCKQQLVLTGRARKALK